MPCEEIESTVCATLVTYMSICWLQHLKQYDLPVTCKAGKQATHSCSCTPNPPQC